MPKGRPRTYAEETERLEARRAKVRLNVQAFRRRQKEKAREAQDASTSSSETASTDGRTPGDRDLVARFDMPFRNPNPCCIAQSTRFEFLGDIFDNTTYHKVNNLTPKFPLGKRLDPVSEADLIISALQRRYVPDGPIPIALSYSPGARIAQFCSTWITTGTISNTPGARILRSALLATALSVVGFETNDTCLLASGFQAQTIAFQKMRHALDSLAAGKGQLDTSMLAITILFCASSELTINKSWENYWKHMHGVGALVERGGVSNLSSSASRDLFYGYRTLQIPFCFTQRRAHFLAQRRWIDLAWRRDNVLSNDHMQTMLDIAFQIPGDVQDYDESRGQSPEDLRARIQRLRELALRLDEWKADMDMSCMSWPYRMKPATWPGVYTEAIKFEDLTVAMPFTSSCGVRVHLFDLVRQIAEDLSQYEECHDSAQLIVQAAISECLKWSRTACQCMEFFQVQKSKFKIVGRLISLFPFDAAWGSFSRFSRTYGMDLQREMRWCQGVARKYDACGLPVLCWR